MASRANHTSVGLAVSDRDTISKEALTISAELGRRTPIGEVIAAAFRVAMRHRGELIAELKGETAES